ncbi:molybdopterin-dependent oxidoreductase [Acidihalobacter ferrooxydans]|uniref:Biotin transporter BioY n=1 Tax=Acidihalobacter ferrooxydans TaxID=1765967 RepID=A0A1P8UG22_9GAMM|nr:molybdopterin-dependent oxidoreductase [Acidihalobacter ferrooxydans]APZ42779.1 biotin transporter BioY [Acidihalobacter ferrooxydans]
MKPVSETPPQRTFTMTHWGVYELESAGGRLLDVRPWRGDPAPSPIGRSLLAVDHPRRVRAPRVSRGWLDAREGRRRARRGSTEFVEMPWHEVLDRVASELDRVRQTWGNTAIYAGSYGWASAGRFHHAQSQMHRFMNTLGGYTRSVNNYSFAAADVIVPHVLGCSYRSLQDEAPDLAEVARHTALVLTFGGIPLKNAQIEPGGQGRHLVRDLLRTAHRQGCRFVNVSPLRDDVAAELEAEWLPLRPNTDTALMLGLAHTLYVEKRYDRAFVQTYTTGFERFSRYLPGTDDGQPKDAAWAAALTGVPAARIRALARELVAARSLINVSWSVQRADHGEQPYWMAITLAAMIGQIGLPGGGFAFGYGAVGSIGNGVPRVRMPSLPGLRNPVDSYIPVARISDMLLNPGSRFAYNGRNLVYPDIRLVYWVGGNPFHHHQDLNRLLEAWQRPETIIVHEPFMTATAQHADIVLPATTPLERNDLGGASQDNVLVAMRRAIPPVGQARDDYAIFSDLAQRLGVHEAFTEGRSEMDWLRYLYARLRVTHDDLPEFDVFWTQGIHEFAATSSAHPPCRLLRAFREQPLEHPLATPSGRIEIGSDVIELYGYADCPGHPVWLEPGEWLGGAEAVHHPLHLLSNQPATRLHSQWEHGVTSQQDKINGLEALQINPGDARARGVRDGDVVLVRNARGRCLAGARVTDALMPGVVILPTGAPFEPAAPGVPGSLELRGNPNVLTRDHGTSQLAQGPSAQTCLVEVERYDPAADPR